MKYVVVDLETTGNAARGGVDKIIELAAVVIEDGEVQEIFSTFLNPGKSIPPFISELTGIYDEMVQRAPLFADIAPMVMELLEEACFVAHNVHFDWGFLQEELRLAGYTPPNCQMIDTVELARILLPTADSYKLGDLAKYFQLDHDNPHRADSDAMVTADLFLHLCKKLDALPSVTLQTLHRLSQGLKSDIAHLIIRSMRYVMYQEETPYDVYRNIALRKGTYDVQFVDEDVPTFPTFLETTLTRLHRMPSFTKRDGQHTMMEEVHNTFQEEKISLLEVGTGTGKTLAYLLPAVFHACKMEKPVLISTKTVQLQQQIAEKEVPLLQQIIPFSFRVALLKGRKHYLCLHKFEHALAEEDTNYDNVLTKAKIIVWLLQTETGDVDELNLPSGGRILWERICSNPMTGQSPWSSRCFYQRAKHRVYFADLVITNHALLFQDLQQEDALLSSYEYVVLDEAHHIEEVSSRALGEQFSCLQFHLLLAQIGTLETNERLRKLYDIENNANKMLKKINEIVKDVKFESDELFRMLRAFVFERSPQKEETLRLAYRYRVKNERGRLWRAMVEITNRLHQRLIELHKQWELCAESASETIAKEEVAYLINRLVACFQVLQQLLLEDDEAVTWIETDVKGTVHSTILYKQPIDVSALLKEQLFTKKKAVVLTSATLTVDGSFSYIKDMLGLSSLHPHTLQIPSPFQYEEQVKMMVPTDVPHIKDVTQEQYVKEVATRIIKIAKTLKGRMLVLFTSYEMQKQTYAIVKEEEDLQEFAILAASGNSRGRTTKNFQQFDKAILFGTNALWEGIDIPFQCLVMVRLPFTPPNDPLLAAKGKMIKEKGENPFLVLSLPQAVLRFKQGFGRLIRTTEDKGFFFVLDRRITTTFYGKKFLTSIPNVHVYEEDMAHLLARLEK